MVKSRFVVLQMKDIVRTGIFVVIGLVLLIALIWAIMPRSSNTDMGARNFIPGTYTSYIIIHNRPIGVLVTVDENKIIDITLSEMAESQEVFYPLIRPTMATLSQEVISKQSTNIEGPADAAVTSRILLDAINNALAQASAEN
ncbi:MAG: FMN-binding protein [Defluviitaleaceae bacterium]|nr:FMN-binding protein [Defluviitaleaceae bacterium]